MIEKRLICDFCKEDLTGEKVLNSADENYAKQHIFVLVDVVGSVVFGRAYMQSQTSGLHTAALCLNCAKRLIGEAKP